ncbi:MAG: replicative DNA helicase, partial [Deltaproteobacteria bacterium]
TNALRNAGQLEEIGGAAYLASIIDTVPAAPNVHYYARIVHDKARLRRLITKANAISRRCYEDPGPVDEIVDFAESAIFEIAGDQARPAFRTLGKVLEQNFDTLEKRREDKSLITGVPTGYSSFDNMTSGLQGSDLIILAARPSMGKTALALNMARNAAVDANVPVAFFSLEMSIEQLSMRMLCSEARVDSFKLRSGFSSPDDWKSLTDAASILTPAPIFIDDSPDLSVMEIRAKARRLKMDKGLGIVIIDYLQLMRTRGQSERRDLEISEISRSLKILAKEINVPVIALSQLNRKLEERHDKRPQLSDLRESGALEQDADVVVFIYRDEVYHQDEEDNKGKAELIIAKQRNGPVGKVPLTFLHAYTRFEESAESHYPAGQPD